MRVGTRTYFFDVSFNARDHPHACGDKDCGAYPIHFAGGSSPCVWGQVDIAVNAGDSSGIIPMRVGTRRLFIRFICCW